MLEFLENTRKKKGQHATVRISATNRNACFPHLVPSIFEAAATKL